MRIVEKLFRPIIFLCFLHFRDCMRTVDQLYIQLQNSMVKLVKLSENRLRKLEKCLHLREFEEESNKVC